MQEDIQLSYKFQSHLISLSENKTIKYALDEWYLFENIITFAFDMPYKCICQHSIKTGYFIYNKTTTKFAFVGTGCARKFRGATSSKQIDYNTPIGNREYVGIENIDEYSKSVEIIFIEFFTSVIGECNTLETLLAFSDIACLSDAYNSKFNELDLKNAKQIDDRAKAEAKKKKLEDEVAENKILQDIASMVEIKRLQDAAAALDRATVEWNIKKLVDIDSLAAIKRLQNEAASLERATMEWKNKKVQDAAVEFEKATVEWKMKKLEDDAMKTQIEEECEKQTRRENATKYQMLQIKQSVKQMYERKMLIEYKATLTADALKQFADNAVFLKMEERRDKNFKKWLENI